METMYAILGSLTTFLAVLVLHGGRLGTSPKSLLRRKVMRYVRVLLGALGASRVVNALDSTDSWHALGEEIVVSARGGQGGSGSWTLPEGLVRTSGQGVAAVIVGDALLALVLCLVALSPIGVPIAIAVALAGVPIWHQAQLRRIERELTQEMPGVFRTLAMAIGSGETLAQAIEYLGAHEGGHAAKPFARASLRMRCGESAEEALMELSRELEAPGVGLLTTALLISQRTGSPLKSLFGHAAKMVERQGEFERMLEVKTAQVRLSVRIVCGLPVIMIAALSILSPDFRAGLATLPGMVSVMTAVVMDAFALNHHQATHEGGRVMDLAYVGGCLSVSTAAFAMTFGLLGHRSSHELDHAGGLGERLESIVSRMSSLPAIRELERKGRESEARRACLRSLPTFLDVVTLGLSSGLSFDAALSLYCERYEDDLSSAFGEALLSWQIGAESRSSALDRLAEELDVGALKSFSSTVSQALKFGSPLASALESQAQAIREEQRSQLEEEIEKVPVKMLIPLGTLIVPAMLLSILGPLIGSSLAMT